MTKRLLLIRHGATDMTGRLCGHSDPPLNFLGRAQIQALPHSLPRHGTEHLYSSDLLRATQTAEALAKAWGVPIHTDAGLREMSFGAWEGLSWPQVQAAARTDTRKAIALSPEMYPPDAERFADFRARVSRTLRELVTTADVACLAAVTHTGVIRTALTDLAGIASDSELLRAIGYCSAFELSTDGASWSFIQRFAAPHINFVEV